MGESEKGEPKRLLIEYFEFNCKGWHITVTRNVVTVDTSPEYTKNPEVIFKKVEWFEFVRSVEKCWEILGLE